MKYAVVENGRNQIIVREGETVLIDEKGLETGSEYKWDKVLLLRDSDKLEVGKPYLEGVKVTGIVRDEIKGPKVVNFKKKRRKGYTRKVGHRQGFTRVTVEEIK